jgi:hypothetical protein
MCQETYQIIGLQERKFERTLLGRCKNTKIQRKMITNETEWSFDNDMGAQDGS